MIRPIAIGLAPNLETDDILIAFRNLISGRLFTGWGLESEKIKVWFKNNLNLHSTFLFNSARSALYVALLSLELKKEDEVIVQAFTCVAVPNAVIWAKGKPIFADINKENLSLNLDDLMAKITPKTKAIIVQHTFGIPANIKEIMKIAQKYRLVVIEDCAHCIKVSINKQSLGTFGDMAIFSFGRDKAISAVFGGLLSVNNKKYLTRVSEIYEKLSFPSKVWIIKQHFHLIFMGVILPLYNFLNIGKLILFLNQKLDLFTPPVYQEEKIGIKPDDFPKRLQNSLGVVVLNQLEKIDKFNKIRRYYTEEYNKLFPRNPVKTNNLPLLRYPLIVEKRDLIMNLAKKKKILFGNWYNNIVDPKGVNLKKINYQKCPTAENVAQHIINLPTYPTLSEKDFRKVLSFIKEQNQYFQ